MFVRYFDLGAHTGGEIARMRRILACEPLVSGWEAYAFEAHPGLARRCRWRFCLDARVKIVPVALGDREGACTLHLNRNLVGSSIYAGKNNVIPGKRIDVPCMRLSRYLGENLPKDWTQSFNIIKSNIEGAEWEVWHDLAEHGLAPAFDLWLGSKAGHDGWTEDFPKIAGMNDKVETLTAAFREAGIYVYRFSCADRRVPNSDVASVLHDALARAAQNNPPA